MKIGDLKKRVLQLKDLNQQIHQNHFLALLDAYREEQKLNAELRLPITAIFTEFWQAVFADIALDKWKPDVRISLWLDLQKALSGIFCEDGKRLIAADSHHVVLYSILEKQYDAAANTVLALKHLMPLVQNCARVVGYANKDEIYSYPLGKLSSEPKIGEKLRYQKALVLLSCLFILIQQHCTAQQLKLLPNLIYCRPSTTEEERRSELAILQQLSTRPSENCAFFSERKEFLDGKVLKEEMEPNPIGLEIRAQNTLEAVKDLLPQTRLHLLKAINSDAKLTAPIARLSVFRNCNLVSALALKRVIQFEISDGEIKRPTASSNP